MVCVRAAYLLKWDFSVRKAASEDHWGSNEFEIHMSGMKKKRTRRCVNAAQCQGGQTTMWRAATMLKISKRESIVLETPVFSFSIATQKNMNCVKFKFPLNFPIRERLF